MGPNGSGKSTLSNVLAGKEEYVISSGEIKFKEKYPDMKNLYPGKYVIDIANKILKKILPRGLFYRSLIIVAAPIIILQLIISIVFFDSIWIKANKGMTKSLVSEIKTLFDVYCEFLCP